VDNSRGAVGGIDFIYGGRWRYIG